MNIRIKKLTDTAKIPTQGSAYAAGYDLCACLEQKVVIASGNTIVIPTGLAFAVPIGYAGLIYARSGLATKHGLRPANCVGVLDSDYRGECRVALYNDSPDTQIICPGERIAQFVVTPVSNIQFDEVDKLDETDRGDGGFGSTGK